MKTLVLGTLFFTLCSYAQNTDRIRVNYFNKHWKLQYIVKEIGLKESDVVRKDIYIGNPPQKIISSVIGPIFPLDTSKKIFDCANNSVMKTTESALYDLNGSVIAKFKHLGLQRECKQLDHTNMILMVFNDVKDGKPINNILAVDGEGKVLIKKLNFKKKRLEYKSKENSFSVTIKESQLPR